MAKCFMAVIIVVLCIALVIVHEYPIASDPYRGIPEASQLLHENPEAKTVEISASTLEDVLNDFRRQRDSYHSAVTKAAIFNAIAVLLRAVLYRLLQKRELTEDSV